MTSATADPVGTLATALAHAARLVQLDPDLAVEQAVEILKIVPENQPAQQILAAAHRARGDSLILAGDAEAADDAYAQSIKASTRDPLLMQAAVALCDNHLAVAEHTLRARLKAAPTDVAAIRMLAEVAARLGRFGDSEKLLTRCLELAPGFAPARHNLAIVLHRQNKPAEAMQHIDRLLAQEPGNANYRNLKAAALARLGEYEQCIALYAGVLKEHPRQPKVWMSYGHALKTAGRSGECIDAYRASIAQAPHFGEAWWSLANLKTFRFTDDDIAAMQAGLVRTDLTGDDRLHLHFALGKAFEDRSEPAQSFDHYAQGAAVRRSAIDYNSAGTTEHVRRSQEFFTRDLFTAHAGHGDPAPDPIFIVGLPRSGSTLVEQILASHSAIEGTMELPDLGMIAKQIGEKKLKSETSKYPEALADFSAEQLQAWGARYLERTRIQRKTGRPLFIDKMPNNFTHVGLIHLILPNAKIIDARRHPMAACFSAFKQHFARGQGFSYSLDDVGRYYRDYVALMAHFDAVLPGRVHRVIYEHMVADTEGEIRRLLAYCGLPFEDSCLRFYENDRAVRTASSEQVRQPIFSDSVEHWRAYEPWLDPLKAALGPVLETYPAAPGV